VLAAQDADAPVFSMPADVEPAACIIVATKSGTHIFHASSVEEAE
jgi:hypothetical protein